MFGLKRVTGVSAIVALLFATASATTAETNDYDLTGFDRIDVATGIYAQVEVGEQFSVSVESSNSDIFEDIVIEVKGGKLSAYVDRGLLDSWLGGEADVNLFISLPELIEVEVSSGADVIVSGSYGPNFSGEASSGALLRVKELSSDDVSFDVSSGASVRVSGDCTELDVDATFGSDFDAVDLECVSVTADVSSGASAAVFASGSIEADASSGGSVDVSGSPKTTDVDESSGGDIRFSY